MIAKDSGTTLSMIGIIPLAGGISTVTRKMPSEKESWITAYHITVDPQGIVSNFSATVTLAIRVNGAQVYPDPNVIDPAAPTSPLTRVVTLRNTLGLLLEDSVNNDAILSPGLWNPAPRIYLQPSAQVDFVFSALGVYASVLNYTALFNVEWQDVPAGSGV